MPAATPHPPPDVIDLRDSARVGRDRQVVALPDEFVAYVEILRSSHPEAHAAITGELAAADEGPAAAETALRARRAQMLSSLELAIARMTGDDAPGRAASSADAPTAWVDRF